MRCSVVVCFLLLASCSGSADTDAGVRDGGMDGGSTDGGGRDAAPPHDADPPPPPCMAPSDQVDLCVDDGARCEVRFRDGSGCVATCAAMGRVCVESYDDDETACALWEGMPPLGCTDTGHDSDYCVCGLTGAPDAGPPIDVDAGPASTRDVFRAFPEAEGYGAMALTECDRDAVDVVFVDSLADSGPGTLREAVTGSDDGRYRIVVFRTGGTIALVSGLTIRRSCLYLAGQSAPGQGIQIRHAASVAPSSVTNLISGHPSSDMHDVVLRYLRFRSGRGEPGRADNVTFRAGEHLVLDHLSGAYGNDECFSMTTSSSGQPMRDVTVQRCIMAAPLSDHQVGSIIGRSSSDGAEASGFSVHHNFYAHMTHRNPMLQSAGDSEVLSNLIYGWASRVSRIHGETSATIAQNVMVPSPRNPNPDATDFYKFNGSGAPRVRFDGNIAEGYGPVGWDEYYNDSDDVFVDRATFELTSPPSPTVPVTLTPATDVRADVLADVGANATLACDGTWIRRLDVVDRWVVDSLAAGTGPNADADSDSPDDYAGYATLDPGVACPDADSDGMPDAFEARFALDSATPSATEDSDGDGYLDVEEYLNGTSPR